MQGATEQSAAKICDIKAGDNVIATCYQVAPLLDGRAVLALDASGICCGFYNSVDQVIASCQRVAERMKQAEAERFGCINEGRGVPHGAKRTSEHISIEVVDSPEARAVMNALVGDWRAPRQASAFAPSGKHANSWQMVRHPVAYRQSLTDLDEGVNAELAAYAAMHPAGDSPSLPERCQSSVPFDVEAEMSDAEDRGPLEF